MNFRSGKAFRFATFLSVFAMVNSSCDLLETILHTIEARCATPTFNVTTTIDSNSGACTETDCALRNAIILSNICAGTQSIALPAGTYTLTLLGTREDRARFGDLDITESVNITGSGGPIIDGLSAEGVFDIKEGATIHLDGIVIQHGDAPWGGGITNAGILFGVDLLIQDNRSELGGSGAAIQNTGDATLTNSAIVHNVSIDDVGAAINNSGSGNMSLENVTVSDNTGRGIISQSRSGSMDIRFSTIADNVPGYQIFSVTSRFAISNSIVSGGDILGNCFTELVSGGYNIDNDGTDRDTCGFNQPGDLNRIDPQLLPLGSYGGPTPTRALAPTSPARDTANRGACIGTDQRGVPRPQGPQCDRGAYEFTDSLAVPSPFPLVIATPETPTLEATKSGIITLTLAKNANCRRGPGTVYSVLTSVSAGQTVELTARNEDNTWWFTTLPGENPCWISMVAGTPNGDTNQLPVKEGPPTPPPTAPPVVDCTQYADQKACTSAGCSWNPNLNKCH